MTLIKSYPRFWTLEAGRVMVVTDLHGDWPAYTRYRDRFIELQARGQVDWLLLTGDLIHSNQGGPNDKSIDIVLDVIKLREQFGEAIIYLCGNHELPHLYHFVLSKGDHTYTPEFEQALNASQRRAAVLALFDELPFYLRTKAGVSVVHAGAPAPITQPGTAEILYNWSHQEIMAWADEAIAQDNVVSLRNGYAKMQRGGIPYDMLAKHYLAVSGPDDPRFNDLIRGFIATSHPQFNRILWPALFNKCEQEYGKSDYGIFLDALLQEFSKDYVPQHVLIAAHITIRGGYQIVANRHLRLASAHHATPREAGQYLIFDAAQPVSQIKALLPGLGSVFK